MARTLSLIDMDYMLRFLKCNITTNYIAWLDLLNVPYQSVVTLQVAAQLQHHWGLHTIYLNTIRPSMQWQ